jgi:gliding motility-associated-like protein
LSPGTYTVTVTDNSCVPQTQQATITITPGGNLASTQAQTNISCANGCNGTATLTASGGQGPYTYLWTPGNQTGSTATGLCPGNYSCTATDANGCTVTQTFAITAPPPLTLSSSGFNVSCANVCDGQLVAIPGGGTPNYSFLWSSGCTSASCSNVCAGTYNVTLTDANGCTMTATTTLTAPPAINIATSTTPASCQASDGSAIATFNGGTGQLTPVWYNPATANDTMANIPAGNYYVVVTDANGCSDTAFATVPNVPGVIATAGPQTNISCFGGNNGSFTVNDNNVNAPYTYAWSCSPSTTNTANGLTAGNCSVTLTDATGCTSTVTFTITQPPQLTLNVNAVPPSICAGQSSNLTVVGGGGTPGYQYAWMPIGMTGATQTVTPPATTTYTVYITDANLCADSSTVTVTVNDQPVALLVGDSLSGCAPLCVNFNDLSTVTAPSTINSWSWNFGDLGTSSSQNPQHCYSSPGAYTVALTVTTGAGCASTVTMNNYINVYANPIAAFSATPQPATELEPDITFTDASTNAFTWNWDFGDTTANSNLQNPTHAYVNPGCYPVVLTVTTVNGCTDTAEQLVCMDPDVAIYVPNAFTPNGDGNNDFFFPKGVGLDETRYQLWIFDRWGNLIFTTTDWNQGWDGKVQGKSGEICQIDTYVWKIKVYDLLDKKHNLIGKVSIIK